MDNVVIKSLTKDHGNRILKYFKSKGVWTFYTEALCSEAAGDVCIYYGLINGQFDNWTIYDVTEYGAEIIELPEEKSLPRKMLVWGNDARKHERIMLAILPPSYKYRYIAVTDGYEDDFNNSCYYGASAWEYAEELPEKEPAKKMTVSEICKALGEEIEIVKE